MFTITDTLTGEYPDVGLIAKTEEWAKGLIWTDVEGFALTESGSLILLDECGNFVYCPSDRFKIKWEF